MDIKEVHYCSILCDIMIEERNWLTSLQFTVMLILLQLPDYSDVIEHPMDFGTIRKKLARNAYRSLEQFEVILT